MIQDKNLIETKSNMNESTTGSTLLLNSTIKFSLNTVKSSIIDKLGALKKPVSMMDIRCPMAVAKKVKNPYNNSSGNSIIVSKMLRKSWITPAEMARRKALLLVTKLSATRLEVKVVPTLAPMIIGTAFSKLREPVATTATIMDVLVELL